MIYDVQSPGPKLESHLEEKFVSFFICIRLADLGAPVLCESFIVVAANGSVLCHQRGIAFVGFAVYYLYSVERSVML